MDGYCDFTRIQNGNDRFEVCSLSFSLARGQIELQGTFDQNANPNTFGVVGGSGIYRGAGGQVVLDFAHAFKFTFDLLPSR